jgi:hypothetical protein
VLVKIVETIGKSIDMGDEDKLEIIDIAGSASEDAWLSQDYSTEHYDWLGDQPISYSDIESWLLEKSIEATSSNHSERNIDAKRELYLLKCKVDRIYDSMPTDVEQERTWDKEEVHRLLKGGNNGG